MGTQENQNAEKLERERTVGAGISHLIQKSYEATAICGITKAWFPLDRNAIVESYDPSMFSLSAKRLTLSSPITLNLSGSD